MRPNALPTLFLALLALVLPLTPAAPVAALGDGALLYVAPSALTVGYDGLRFALMDAGASPVDVLGTWPAGQDLAASYRLVVITAYDGPLETGVGDDLAAFVSAGGGLVVMAEHSFGDQAGNAIAERLGLTARFDVGDTGGGCNGTEALASHALTEGAPTLEFAWSRTVTGGTMLYGTTAPIVTLDGTVVLAGDSDIFSDPVALGGCPVGPSTQRFYANLFTSLADPTGGPGGDGGLADAGVSGDAATTGALGSACTRNEECGSSLCARDGDRSYCTQLCTDVCPAGFSCASAGGVSVCVLPAPPGGCQASPARTFAPLALVGYALALGIAGRRRGRARARVSRRREQA